MRRMLLLLVVFPLIATTGCAYLAREGAKQEAMITEARAARYDVPRNEVQDALVATFVDLGYRFEQQTETNGYYETSWASRQYLGTLHNVRFIARITGDGPYAVDVEGTLQDEEDITPKPFEDEIYLNVHERLADD